MALADTGSDLMLVSSDFAQRRGLVIETGRKYHTEVELADGTRTWTSGIVSRATWAIGNDPVLCDFHVMHGLPADIILSKTYLFERDVFSNHSESFFNIDSVEDISLLCGIRLIEKELYDSEKLESDFLRDVTSQEAFDFQAQKRERIRRTLAAKKIATLSPAERPGALHREEEKKQRWDAARAQHKIRWNTADSRQ
ncbi:hypothetical protein K4K59_005676 [Colletotrichum sp. SAR11_240]|nr:hypothetical protein K4K59_005676 [Colletotrichum sp. SAR11_240]